MPRGQDLYHIDRSCFVRAFCWLKSVVFTLKLLACKVWECHSVLYGTMRSLLSDDKNGFEKTHCMPRLARVGKKL